MAKLSLIHIPMVLFSPKSAFASMGGSSTAVSEVFLRYAIWTGMVPPLCAWIGMSVFGWRLGLEEPVHFTVAEALVVSLSYYIGLLVAFVASAKILMWLQPTYAAKGSNGDCYTLVALMGTPLMLGGVFHLYPSVVLNTAVLVPCFIWSAWLLYLGADKVLKTDSERGMLMASAMLGFMLIALAAFLAVMSLVWGVGFDQELGV